MPMRSIVTGATGMIGGRLALFLSEKYGPGSVTALTNRLGRGESDERARALKSAGIRVLPMDFLRDRRLPEDIGPYDAVFHLAANLRTDLREDSPNSPMRVNDLGTENLLRWLDGGLRGKTLVYTSSIAATDRAGPESVPLTEASPCVPRTLYGLTKLRGENAVRKAARETGFRFSIFRLATVYGPNARRGHIYERFSSWIREGALPGRLLWPGRISLVHVDDVVEVLEAAVRKPRLQGEIFFLANDEEVTVGEWARVIAEESGKDLSFYPIPRALSVPLSRLAYQDRLWSLLPQAAALTAWRLSLILSDGFFCDSSKLMRAYPKKYIDVREGVRRVRAELKNAK